MSHLERSLADKLFHCFRRLQCDGFAIPLHGLAFDVEFVAMEKLDFNKLPGDALPAFLDSDGEWHVLPEGWDWHLISGQFTKSADWSVCRCHTIEGPLWLLTDMRKFFQNEEHYFGTALEAFTAADKMIQDERT